MLLALLLATQAPAVSAAEPAPPSEPVQARPRVVPPPPLPEPAGLPRVAYTEAELVPRRHRRDRGVFRQWSRTGGRLGFGAAGRLAGPLPTRAAFSLDALAVARVPLTRGHVAFGMFPELGYSLLAGAQHTRGHFFTGGVGLGLIKVPYAVAIIPRAVAGALDRERAVGVRTSLLAEGSRDGGFSLEISHEALFVPRDVIHQVRVMLSITVLLGR